MTFKVKVNDPHFQYQLRESQDANLVQFGDSSSNTNTNYHADKQNFPEFLVKVAKIALVNDLHFHG